MSTCLFAWPIRSDDATLSGGSYESEAPITNLQLDDVDEDAVTTDATIASATVNADFGAAVSLRFAGDFRHNFQKDALWRLRASNNADMSSPEYDSGWISVWPVQWASGVLFPGHPNYATRLLTNAQIAALNPPRGMVHIFPSLVTARYWRREVDDTTNTEGNIRSGRFVLAPVYQPSMNMEAGAQIGYDDPTVVNRAYSNTRIYNERPKGRVQSMTFRPLGNDEGRGVMQEMYETLGLNRQLVFCHDPDDTYNLKRNTWLCNLKQPSSLEYAAAGTTGVVVVVEEVV